MKNENFKLVNVPKAVYDKLEDVKYEMNSNFKRKNFSKRISYGDIISTLLTEYSKNPNLLEGLNEI